MTDTTSPKPDPDTVKALWQGVLHGSYVPFVAVLALSIWVTLGAISKSELIGRLVDPMTHNDVNYLIDGIRRLIFIELNGFRSELAHLYFDPMHAPLTGYQAALGFYLFGFHDWAPYASNIIYVLIFLSTCAALLRGTPNLVVVGGLLATAGLPLTYTTVSEFAPETAIGLFTALGVLLTLRIPMLERALGARVLSGLCFGLGFLGKPSSFVFVPLIVCATLMIAFLRDIVFARRLGQWKRAIGHGAMQFLLSLWLPALYVVPNFGYYSDYFYTALFDVANVKAFGAYRTEVEHLRFYVTGPAAEFIFGNLLWLYVAIVGFGIAAASRRDDRTFITQQVSLMPLVFLMWLLPTASIAKNTLLGMPFSYLLWFMVILALGSIYQSLRDARGTAAVLLLAVLCLMGTSRPLFSNTSEFAWLELDAHIVREAWPRAQDRFRAVMLRNSPDYYGGSLYLTNVGYYHVPTIWYWLLKQDPTLDWRFYAQWQDPNPQHHLDFIRQNRMRFVIAGERGNGLTFAPALISGAAGSEDAVLAALWNDRDYAPIDQFYGPAGRTITVFERRAPFSGWGLLGGMTHPGSDLRPWVSDGPISHIEAYAPDAVPGELSFEAEGTPGATIDVIVNKAHVAGLSFDASGHTSLTHAFNLVSGQNDIVFRYSSVAPVKFIRLQVLRKLRPDGEVGQ